MTPDPPRPNREESLEVVVEDVVFRSDDSRFAVVRCSRTSRAGEAAAFTAVGDLGGVSAGETLSLHGKFTTHPRHGERFRVESFAPVIPSSVEGMKRYLGSGAIDGIGPSLADRLVGHFGEKTMEIIATQSRRLTEVSGIGAKRAETIAAALRERRGEAESLSFLHALGLGPSIARRVLDRFGRDTARTVRDDPYLVAEQVAGVGFRTADALGASLGISKDDPRRAAGATLHLLGRGADQGHTFLTRAELVERARELSVSEAPLLSAIEQLEARRLVVVEDEAVYPPPLHRAEVEVARAVRALLSKAPRARSARPLRADESLSPAQASAVEESLHHGLFLLTGGPGTGKTTTVRAIVRAHESLERRVLLAAPTGRAAKRLSDAAEREAKTIHRLLEWNPLTGRFSRDAAAPLDAETVLVDETSMLDVRLAASLLAAIAEGTRVIFVGDVDQLPPVAPGQVLRALAESGVCPRAHLSEVFRQASESTIVRAAHAILRGDRPEPTPSGTRGPGDLFLVAAPEPERTHAMVDKLLDRMRDAYGIDPARGCQILSPMRRGPFGTDALNERVREKLNPASREKGEGYGFRSGDKVMQLKNDYEREVYNGDLGVVRRITAARVFVDFEGREVQYGPENLDALALAYASTVHKVQGSEFDATIVVLHTSQYVLLDRAMIYTALTRAKKLAILVGDPRAVEIAVKNARRKATNDRLAERVAADG